MDAKEIVGKRICHNCRWYDNRLETGDGPCRINPPVPDPDSTNHNYRNGLFPIVSWNDWCGSWDENLDKQQQPTERSIE